MIEILNWVKRVSHVNKVSSNKGADKYLKFFVVAFSIISICGHSSGKVLASEITAQKIIELANADRREKGIEGLKENKKLSQAAEYKSLDMISKNYFSHNAPDGATPWHWIEKSGYDYNYAGENLAMDFRAAEKMNEAWLASPTHRANILNAKYKDIGVAIRDGIVNGHETMIAVQMFGSGDRNAPTDREAEKEKSGETAKPREDSFPKLPVGKIKENKLAFFDPIITSPPTGAVLPQYEKTEIAGRALPGTKIYLFEKNSLIGETITDRSGWFRKTISNISSGEHNITAKREMPGGQKINAAASSAGVSFQIDADEPTVRYQLFASVENENKYILKIFSDEQYCEFELGGERISTGKGGSATFAVPQGLLSGTLHINDRAGNKSNAAISLAGLHYEEISKNIMAKLADKIYPEKFWINGSEREALKKNLGLAPYQFFSPRLADSR